MRIALVSAAAVALAGGAAFAQCDIDQNQPNSPAYMAAFNQTDLAQSFQHQDDNSICGAGIFLQPNIGSSDNVTIELWEGGLPRQGTMIATGSAQGTQGQWVDVFWTPVAIQANTTYYLHFTGNTSLGIAGDTNNPYPHGHVYANSGFNAFPTFDYTFRTYSETATGLTLRLSGSCPGTVTVAWDGATASSNAGLVFASNQGSVNINFGACAGTELGLGSQNLQLVRTFNTGPNGSGQFSGQAGAFACGGFAQIVVADGSPCDTSNVEQLP